MLVKSITQNTELVLVNTEKVDQREQLKGQ